MQYFILYLNMCENNGKLIIGFNHERQWFGGFGDRVLGIINSKLIAKLLNREFKIHWTKENIKEYIDYSNFDIDIEINNLNNYKIFYMIDCLDPMKQVEILKLIMSCDKSQNIILWLNQNVAKQLYYLLSKKNIFNNDILNEYKFLYTEILKPTNYSLNKINNLINNKEYIIGIQIRCGADAKMLNNRTQSEINRHNNKYATPAWSHISQTQDLNSEISEIFNNIKNKYKDKNNNYYVFITSDYSFYNIDDIFLLASMFWNKEQIIYLNEPAQHIDRPPMGDFSKFYIDNYILSQYTQELYFTPTSNYGKIAALACYHNEIYSIHNVDSKILKSDLF